LKRLLLRNFGRIQIGLSRVQCRPPVHGHLYVCSDVLQATDFRCFPKLLHMKRNDHDMRRIPLVVRSFVNVRSFRPERRIAGYSLIQCHAARLKACNITASTKPTLRDYRLGFLSRATRTTLRAGSPSGKHRVRRDVKSQAKMLDTRCLRVA
jgi:hypothetical protein